MTCRPRRACSFPNQARLYRVGKTDPRLHGDRVHRLPATRTGLGAPAEGERGAASEPRGQCPFRHLSLHLKPPPALQDTVARRTALATEISTTLKPFFCALCDKQFQNVAQYDEHTNSYAHHHKARMRDMQTNSRAIIAKEDLDKRKEKERKREEKELRKLAKAQGVKIAKSALPPQQVPSVPPMEDVGQPQKEAAAPIIADSPSNRSGSMQPSWSTAASSSLTPPLPPQPPADPPPPSEPFQPPPPPPRPPSPESVPPSAEPSKTTSDSTASSPPPPPPPPPRTPPPRPPSKQAGASDVEPVRSSWQTFQKSRFRR